MTLRLVSWQNMAMFNCTSGDSMLHFHPDHLTNCSDCAPAAAAPGHAAAPIATPHNTRLVGKLGWNPRCAGAPTLKNNNSTDKLSKLSKLSKLRPLTIALLLILGFAATELGVGLFSHSLALLAESEHLVSDGLALGLSLLATGLAQLPASAQATFGYRRVEILAALVNGVSLLLVSGWIAWAALIRLQSPQVEILSLPMLVTAIAGLMINLFNAALLHGHSHTDLNIRGAFLHMLFDAISSVGVIIAAIVVGVFHWTWADSTISLGIAALIALGALPLIRQSLHILLEKTPDYLDVTAITLHLNSFTGVQSVQNLRLWTIAIGQESLSAHLIVDLATSKERDRLLHQMQISLRQEFGITEVCLQMSTAQPIAPINLCQPPNLLELQQE